MLEKTFAIIKPKPVQAGHTGAILTQIEQAGFRMVGLRLARMTGSEAQELYEAHRDKPFYQELCDYITSGPVLLLALEKEQAVADFRSLIGATNPAEAAPGTLRARFGTSIGHNALHGSDAPSSAHRELALFFGSALEGQQVASV